MATIKQKLAYKEVVKGSTISGAMVKAGYSKTTAKRTNKLTRTKGWQELVDKYISEEALVKVHAEGLGATKQQGVGGMAIGMKNGEVESMGHTEIVVPDYAVRHKYLETGYKIRGRLKESPNGNQTNILNIYSIEQQRRIASRVVNQSESEGTPNRLLDSDEREV